MFPFPQNSVKQTVYMHVKSVLTNIMLSVKLNIKQRLKNTREKRQKWVVGIYSHSAIADLHQSCFEPCLCTVNAITGHDLNISTTTGGAKFFIHCLQKVNHCWSSNFSSFRRRLTILAFSKMSIGRIYRKFGTAQRMNPTDFGDPWTVNLYNTVPTNAFSCLGTNQEQPGN